MLVPYMEKCNDANRTRELAVFHSFLQSTHMNLALFLVVHPGFYPSALLVSCVGISRSLYQELLSLYDTFYRIGLLATQGNCSFRRVQV